jgi:hypothetical protein
LLLLVQDMNLLPPWRPFTSRNAVFRIIRAGYRCGDFACFRQRIYWSQRSGEGERREGIVGACNRI